MDFRCAVKISSAFKFQYKSVHFSFNNDICIQIDEVIAKIFMEELESALVPILNDHIKKWKRFVDDTFV